MTGGSRSTFGHHFCHLDPVLLVRPVPRVPTFAPSLLHTASVHALPCHAFNPPPRSTIRTAQVAQPSHTRETELPHALLLLHQKRLLRTDDGAGAGDSQPRHSCPCSHPIALHHPQPDKGTGAAEPGETVHSDQSRILRLSDPQKLGAHHSITLATIPTAFRRRDGGILGPVPSFGIATFATLTRDKHYLVNEVVGRHRAVGEEEVVVLEARVGEHAFVIIMGVEPDHDADVLDAEHVDEVAGMLRLRHLQRAFQHLGPIQPILWPTPASAPSAVVCSARGRSLDRVSAFVHISLFARSLSCPSLPSIRASVL